MEGEDSIHDEGCMHGSPEAQWLFGLDVFIDSYATVRFQLCTPALIVESS